MPKKAEQARDGSRHQRTELWAIILLSVSALASSYAGFQEGRWDGEQDAHFTLAATAETEAGKEETLALQRESINAMHFTQWLNAYASGNIELERFYRERFRPSFRTAFDQWLAARPRFNRESPPTPFDIPGYHQQSRATSQEHARQSKAYLAAGKRDMRISDSYGRAVMIFALALFLGGMVQAFHSYRRRVWILGLASLTTLIGLISLLSLPALTLG